jgi:predicted transcriptional regulator
MDNNDYECLMFDLFNNTSKKIKKILRKTDNIDEQVEKAIKKLCEDFDKKTVVKDIIDRSFSKLKQSQFITIINEDKDFLPIQNGLKIN